MHYRARVYNPTLKTSMQRDPLGYIDGTSLYQYVGGNPIILVDPSGLGLFDSVKKTASVAKTAVLRFLGQRSPATKLVRPIDVTARALKCGPGVIRIAVGVGHRNKSFRESTSADDFLDRFEQGRDKYVKPGSRG